MGAVKGPQGSCVGASSPCPVAQQRWPLSGSGLGWWWGGGGHRRWSLPARISVRGWGKGVWEGREHLACDGYFVTAPGQFREPHLLCLLCLPPACLLPAPCLPPAAWTAQSPAAAWPICPAVCFVSQQGQGAGRISCKSPASVACPGWALTQVPGRPQLQTPASPGPSRKHLP